MKNRFTSFVRDYEDIVLAALRNGVFSGGGRTLLQILYVPRPSRCAYCWEIQMDPVQRWGRGLVMKWDRPSDWRRLADEKFDAHIFQPSVETIRELPLERSVCEDVLKRCKEISVHVFPPMEDKMGADGGDWEVAFFSAKTFGHSRFRWWSLDGDWAKLGLIIDMVAQIDPEWGSRD